MVDSATRLECGKCLELYIPTEFLEHITSEESCKNALWTGDEKSKNISSENASPIPKSNKKKIAKENTYEEINPV